MTSNEDAGEFGYLTWHQWRAFQWAANEAGRLTAWLHAAGNYSISDPDETHSGSRTDVPLGMPATKLAALEIERLGALLAPWSNLEDIANDAQAAEIAVHLTREVQTATHRWPYEDKPHRVQHIRCQACGLLTLEYRPPEAGGTDAHITCTECSAALTGDEFRTIAELVATSYQEATSARR